MKSFVLSTVTALSVLVLCTAQEGTPDSMPEDDEDSMTSVVFSLHFRATNSCEGNWYIPNILPFTDAFAASVASSINEACDNCGFTVGNLANIAPSCRGYSATFQAKVREWYSMDYPLSRLLGIIEHRFNSSSSLVLTVSTSSFSAGSIDLTHLRFSPTNVSVQIDEVGSGDGDEVGSGDGDEVGSGNVDGASGSGTMVGEETIPTEDEDDITAQVVTTQDLGKILLATDSAVQTRPLLAVIVTTIAMVMGTGLMH